MTSPTLSPFYLAWKQLTAKRVRFTTAMLGSIMSGTLILMQLGFLEGLYGAATALHKSISGQAVIINPASINILQMQPIPPESRSVARGIANIRSFSGIATSIVQWRSPIDGQTRGALMVGIRNMSNDAISFNKLNLSRSSQSLDIIGSVLFDGESRPELGKVEISDSTVIDGFKYAINGSRVNPVGTYTLGAPLCTDGTIFSSIETFNIVQASPGNPITVEVLTLQNKDSRSAAKTVAALNNALPEDAVAFTKQEWIDREIQYWDRSSPIGFIFRFGVAIGMLVGSIVVYQILHSDINDHIKEYATLKAIGYTDNFLTRITIYQGLFLASLSIPPAWMLAFSLLYFGKESTKVPLGNTPTHVIIVAVLAIVSSSASALIASRKLSSVDPADNF